MTANSGAHANNKNAEIRNANLESRSKFFQDASETARLFYEAVSNKNAGHVQLSELQG
jgi:hypothetical protein